jgi:hypothetical protein
MTAWLDLKATLTEATALGASFHVSGTEVRMRSESPLPELLIERLRTHRHILRDYLGASESDAEAVAFLDQLGVTPVLVTEPAIAPILEALEADARVHGGVKAIDIETAPRQDTARHDRLYASTRTARSPACSPPSPIAPHSIPTRARSRRSNSMPAARNALSSTGWRSPPCLIPIGYANSIWSPMEPNSNTLFCASALLNIRT